MPNDDIAFNNYPFLFRLDLAYNGKYSYCLGIVIYMRYNCSLTNMFPTLRHMVLPKNGFNKSQVFSQIYLMDKKWFCVTPSMWSKVGKRRKMDRIEDAPHLLALLKQKTKPTAKDHCLEHFDIFYKKTFGKEWPSIRLAMLSRPKFCALVNNYGNSDDTVKRLTQMGCYSIRRRYEQELLAFKNKNENIQKSSKVAVTKTSLDLSVEIPTESLSMSPEMASKRIINPQEMILGERGNEIDAASASMYDFVPSTKVKGMEDFIEDSAYYSVYETSNNQQKESMPLEVKAHELINFPKYLDAYTFAPSVANMRLEPPKKGSLGTFDYYCMDAASLLPVIVLDVQPGDMVLDMCAAPGGKTLAILQTMMPAQVFANDRNSQRMKRLLDTMSAYLESYEENFAQPILQYRRMDAEFLPDQVANHFDRVLCDVPCTTDRKSMRQNEGNLFNVSSKKTRLKMPETQSALLQSAMKCVKQGGSVVYSTCSLSPVQNDGVVYDALKKVWQDHRLEFIVNDLTNAMGPFHPMIQISENFAHKPRYGQLVLPHMENNFGPMYFAKLTRK